MIQLFLILFVTQSQSQGQCPTDRLNECVKPQYTKLYSQYWNSTQNSKNYFYDPSTFGINIAQQPGMDPCEKMSNQKFLKLLKNNHIDCSGQWCINNQFGQCGKGGQQCYQVEHIFDQQGCTYSVDDTNILANLVMAYGKWNQQVSHARMGSCARALNEKSFIYGKNIIHDVEQQINRCKNKHKRNIDYDILNETYIIDQSNDVTIDNFDYDSECNISCTCQSPKYLDILCGCDYNETDFNRSDCPIFSQDISINTNIPAIVILVLIIVLLIAVIIYFKRTDIRLLYEKVSVTVM